VALLKQNRRSGEQETEDQKIGRSEDRKNFNFLSWTRRLAFRTAPEYRKFLLFS
jgi:hypothetical protein